MRWDFLFDIFSFSTYEEIKTWLYLLIAAIAIIILIIVISVIIYRIRKRKRMELEEDDEITIEIKKLRRSRKNPKDDLLSFSRFVKSYLRQHHGMKTDIGFSEIAQELREKNKENLADFCDEVSYYLYSGIDITKKDIVSLAEKFAYATKRHKIKPAGEKLKTKEGREEKKIKKLKKKLKKKKLKAEKPKTKAKKRKKKI